MNKKLNHILIIFSMVNCIFLHAENITTVTTSIIEETPTHIVVGIKNQTTDTIAILDAYHPANNNDCDNMLYLHRYNPKTEIYSLSFLPLMPFLQYTSGRPPRKGRGNRYTQEDIDYYPYYKFCMIAPQDVFLFQISKDAIYSKEYIEEYYPYQFAYFNEIFLCSARKLKKYKECRPYIGKLKIKAAPKRAKNWIMLEFAVWTKYNIITKQTDKYLYSESFFLNPIECNEQLHEYITVSMPLILNDCE